MCFYPFSVCVGLFPFQHFQLRICKQGVTRLYKCIDYARKALMDILS